MDQVRVDLHMEKALGKLGLFLFAIKYGSYSNGPLRGKESWLYICLEMVVYSVLQIGDIAHLFRAVLTKFDNFLTL